VPHITVRIDGLNKKGVNCFIKYFRKYLLHNEFLTNNSDKHLRKAIKQSNRNSYQNFNRLKLRFNRLFIAAKYQKLECLREREIYTQDLYWFTQSLSYIQSSVKPLSIPLCNQSHITKTTPQKGDFESHKAYPPPLHTQHLKTEHHLSLQDFKHNQYVKDVQLLDTKQDRKHLYL